MPKAKNIPPFCVTTTTAQEGVKESVFTWLGRGFIITLRF